MCQGSDLPKPMAENPQTKAIFEVVRSVVISLESMHRNLTRISAENLQKAEIAGKFLGAQRSYAESHPEVAQLSASWQVLTEQVRDLYKEFAEEFDYDRKISLPVDTQQLVEDIAKVYEAKAIWDKEKWSQFKVIFPDGSEVCPKD